MVNSNKEGLALVRGGAYAFIMETKRMEYLITQDCSLQLVGGSLTQVVQGVALQKGGRGSALLLDFTCCRLSTQGWDGPGPGTDIDRWKTEASPAQTLGSAGPVRGGLSCLYFTRLVTGLLVRLEGNPRCQVVIHFITNFFMPEA